MSELTPRAGDLATTLATWIYLLHETGRRPQDGAVLAACAALSDAGGAADAQGQALVALVATGLGGSEEPANVRSYLEGLYGETATGGLPPGGDREGALRALRTYQFRTSLPFIARIYDRFPDGHVGPHWVMVERVTDQVTCMDPYPWDDLDEETHQPLIEFMVKWELADRTLFLFQA